MPASFRASAREFSARSQISSLPRRFSGRVESCHADLVETEGVVDLHDEGEEGGHLDLHLLGRAVDVGIVLAEGADPRQAVGHAAALVAVQTAEIRVADGQIAVAVLPRAVDEAVGGAVHGLQGVLPLLDLREIHVLLVLVVVPGGLPHAHIQGLGRDHLAVALAQVVLAHVVHQLVVDHRALGVEEGRGRRFGMEGEEAQFLAQLAVIPGLGLFQALQMLVQFLLGVEGRAVDAAELGLLLVAPPVGRRGMQQLEGLQLPRVGHMGPAAEIIEIALPVARDGFARGKFGDQLHLEGFAHGLEPPDGLVPLQVLADHRDALFARSSASPPRWLPDLPA